MSIKRKLSGQSLVEVVVSIGLVLLVISGVVTLVVNSLGARNKGFDRKKATELAQKVTERLLNDKINMPAVFWQQTYWTNNFATPQTDSDFTGYKYTVTATPNNTDPGCTGYTGCVEAGIEVDWVNNGTGVVDPTNSVKFTRFFSRY